MTPSSSEDEIRKDLELACRDRDADKVSRIFAFQQLNADDATAALQDARMDFEVIRVLLQNGADPNSISIRQAASSKRAGELLRLLHEYGYNFKTDGHIVLEFVLSILYWGTVD